MNYNKRGRNYPNILIFRDAKDNLAMHEINEKKNSNVLWIRTCDHVNAKIHKNVSYRLYRLRHQAICKLRYS